MTPWERYLDTPAARAPLSDRERAEVHQRVEDARRYQPCRDCGAAGHPLARVSGSRFGTHLTVLCGDCPGVRTEP